MKKIFIPFLSLVLLTAWSPVAVASGRVISVSTSQQLQDAITSAVGGDEIVLQAGTTFTGPFTLPVKSGSGTITLRSSEVSQLPSGRVSPADAVNMAKIVSAGAGESALTVAPGAHNYTLVGLEFTKAKPSAVVYDLVQLGLSTSEQATQAQVPHDILLDRVYLHGDPTSSLKRGLALNSAATTISNSYFSEFHATGQDAQAIAGFNGPGPFKILNNYVEASTENILFGGADPVIPNLVPSDIEIRGNLVSKPLAWKSGTPHWVVKNLFELKNAQRVTVEGNIFENNWADGQSGYAIVFTPRNQDGTCSWCKVQDVSFQNNIVRNSFRGINILSRDDTHHSDLVARLDINNNSFENIGDWWILLTGEHEVGPNDVKITHNTVKQGGTALYTEVSPGPGFVFSGNIANHNEYGIMGASHGVGDSTLNYFFPSAVFTDNALVGGPAKQYVNHPGNYFPATWDEATTEHPQLGANMTQLNAALNGQTVAEPTPPAAPAPASPGPTPSSGGTVLGDTRFNRPTGSLIKYADNPTVFRLENGLKRAFTSLNTFFSFGQSFQAVITIPSSESYADGPVMGFADGSLLKGPGNTVYLSQNGLLRPFTSGEKFLSLGYNFSQIKTVSDAELSLESSGPAI